ncbi:MAG: hypothetical protein IPO83_19055 [Chitinophagaceae bacterium]|nr:hypothetical protein [Chitinophagaceae bacterium]
MIKDIQIERVQDVAVAVVPEINETGMEEWNVYLLNMKAQQIDGVLISSQGYGSLDGKNIKTSTLRQFFEKISANEYVKVEWIDKRLFGITNEFWVSFWYEGTLFDKRYVFVTESIVENNFTEIPMMGKRGVMIK